MRGKVLRIGKQKGWTTVQSLYSMSCWPSIFEKKKNWKPLENCQKLALLNILKCLSLSRVCRLDFLWFVNKLARVDTQWTRACDRRLARLISYIHHTNDHRQHCHVGKHCSALSSGIVPRPRLCTYTHQNHVLKSLRTFFSDGWDLREYLQRRARKAIINWKFSSDKITSERVQHGVPKFGTKKFRIRIIWVTAWARTFKDDNYWKPIRASSTWENTFVQRIEDEEPFSSRMLCKKLPRNWRILKDAAIKRKILKKTKIGRISYAARSGTVSLFFCDLDMLNGNDGPTFLIKLLLPRFRERQAAKLECREIHERIWVFLETFLMVNMLDEILMNYTMIQEIWQHRRESLMMLRILRKEGNENCGSEEPLPLIPLPCFSVRARRKRLDDK